MSHKISIIIICSLPTRGMKTIGNIALLEYKKQTLIEYHIKTILSIFKKPDIIVVGGFEHKKLKKILEKYPVNFIHHNINDNTNDGSSLLIGMRYVKHNKVIVLDINHLITKKYWSKIIFGKNSSIFINNHITFSNKIGAVINNDIVEHLFFSLPTQIMNMFYLTKNHIIELKNMSLDSNQNKFIFEIINNLIKIEPIKYQTINLKSSLFLNSFVTRKNYVKS